ncbi:hypothetical protein HWV62_1891 [Athelia sp. TMB]|nr:hypothetical protein HWV62_38424 [Athelia sp. TMB]KAF7978020.1 hypothetical protein HWV62_1891 [Athelia sp. TMB]
MVEYMEGMKSNRLEREHIVIGISRKASAIDAISNYKKCCLPWSEVMPQPADYCQFEPVKAILEFPSEVTVNVSTFRNILPQLSVCFAEWRKHLKAKIIQSLDPTAELLLESTIHLATTVFRCEQCSLLNCFENAGDSDNVVLFYPEVLNHQCFTRTLSYGGHANDVSLHLERQSTARKPWSCENLVIDENASKSMDAIVRFCNLDPDSATVADLDNVTTIWFGCPKCVEWPAHSSHARVPLYGWRAAIKHQLEKHGASPLDWLEFSGVQTHDSEALAGALSGLYGGRALDIMELACKVAEEKVWACTHCMDRPCEMAPQSKTGIEQHLSEKHNITIAAIYVDYYETKRFHVPSNRSYHANFDTFQDDYTQRLFSSL